MDFTIAMTGFVALYVFMLAAFAGWVIIGNVPAILHTPLMFFAVLLGAGNAAGGYAVTDRMLAMFKTSNDGGPAKHKRHGHAHRHSHKKS